MCCVTIAAMPTSRRTFLQGAAATAVTMASMNRASNADAASNVSKAELDRILDQPVLTTDFLKEPVTVASIELLRSGRTFILRTRSTDGATALTVPNSDRLANVYPLLLNQ